jgi:uncharacterized metal-binding protein YceD (DUF177 family)
MCSHSTRPGAGPCSQCLGAVPQRVEIRGTELLVDGVPKRKADAEDEQQRFYSRRGGKR